MKCKDCDCCRLGFFQYNPDNYVCTGAPEPFVIHDINVECTEYEYNRNKLSPLPCPFCGGKPVLDTWELNTYEKMYLSYENWWSVFCDDCLAEGPNLFSKEEAIAAWNRRV